MSALSADCARAGGLTSLYSFTFTVHPHWSSNPHWSTNGWMDGVVSLLKDSPLESVQFNATELFPVEGLAVILGDRLCMRIVDQHRDHLIRFSLHGLQLGLPSIDHVCLQCEKLEQLFICVDHATTDMVCSFFFGSRTYADAQVVRYPSQRHLCKRRICVRYMSNSICNQRGAVLTSTR
jgi:hypothetical protein